MAFAPSDLAKLIGITSGPDGHRSTVPTREEADALFEAGDRVRAAPTEHQGFWAEFCSQFLPSFFRTHIQTPWDLSGRHFAVVSGYFSRAVLKFEYLCKFVRENREEVAASFPLQLSRFPPLFENVLAHPDNPTAQASLMSSLVAFDFCSVAYLVDQQHLDPSPAGFPISEDVLSSLRPYRNSLSSLCPADPEIQSYAHATRSALDRIEQLLDSGSLRLPNEDDHRYNRFLKYVWWYCHAIGSEETTAGCVEVEGEMLMCGKSMSCCSILLPRPPAIHVEGAQG